MTEKHLLIKSASCTFNLIWWHLVALNASEAKPAEQIFEEQRNRLPLSSQEVLQSALHLRPPFFLFPPYFSFHVYRAHGANTGQSKGCFGSGVVWATYRWLVDGDRHAAGLENQTVECAAVDGGAEKHILVPQKKRPGVAAPPLRCFVVVVDTFILKVLFSL